VAKQEYLEEARWIRAHPDRDPEVEYHRTGAPEHPIVVRDPGTPAAYPSPVSDVEVDAENGGSGAGEQAEGSQGVGALGLIMNASPLPAPVSNVEEEEEEEEEEEGNGAPCPAGSEGAGSSGATESARAPEPADIEMDGSSIDTLPKPPEPEPQTADVRKEESSHTETDPVETKSSATSNASAQEVMEMLGGAVDAGDGEGESEGVILEEARNRSRVALGPTAAVQHAGADETATTSKFVFLRDKLSIPCGPDLTTPTHLEPTLRSLCPASVSPAIPMRFLLMRDGKASLGPRPLPPGYRGPGYSRPETRLEDENKQTGMHPPMSSSTPNAGTSASAGHPAPSKDESKSAGSYPDTFGERIVAAQHRMSSYARSHPVHTEEEAGNMLDEMTHYFARELLAAREGEEEKDFMTEMKAWREWKEQKEQKEKMERERAAREKEGQKEKAKEGNGGAGSGSAEGENLRSKLGKRKREGGDEDGSGSGKRKAGSSDGEEAQVQAMSGSIGVLRQASAPIPPVPTPAAPAPVLPAPSAPALDITMGDPETADTIHHLPMISQIVEMRDAIVQELPPFVSPESATLTQQSGNAMGDSDKDSASSRLHRVPTANGRPEQSPTVPPPPPPPPHTDVAAGTLNNLGNASEKPLAPSFQPSPQSNPKPNSLFIPTASVNQHGSATTSPSHPPIVTPKSLSTKPQYWNERVADVLEAASRMQGDGDVNSFLAMMECLGLKRPERQQESQQQQGGENVQKDGIDVTTTSPLRATSSTLAPAPSVPVLEPPPSSTDVSQPTPPADADQSQREPMMPPLAVTMTQQNSVNVTDVGQSVNADKPRTTDTVGQNMAVDVSLVFSSF
jgi:hypothetical protein